MLQRTEEWFLARAGKVTASRIADVVARTKTGYGASRANYMAELIAERLTGAPYSNGYTSSAMQRGIEMEERAIAAYSFLHSEVQGVGFVPHPSIEQAGASPDGLVGEDGLVEVKCPNTATHIDTLLGAPIEQKYIYQMQWQMACTGRKWCDFVSFDDRLPPNLAMTVRRIVRDDETIAMLEEEARKFLAEMDGKLSLLKAIKQEDIGGYDVTSTEEHTE